MTWELWVILAAAVLFFGVGGLADARQDGERQRPPPAQGGPALERGRGHGPVIDR